MKYTFLLTLFLFTTFSCKEDTKDDSKIINTIMSCMPHISSINENISIKLKSDTLIVTMEDTITRTFRSDVFERLKMNYIGINLLSCDGKINTFVFHKKYVNWNAEMVKIINRGELTDLENQYYSLHQPFRAISVYILDSLTPKDIIDMQLLINNANDFFLDFDFTGSIIDLVSVYSLEHSGQSNGNFATTRIRALATVALSADNSSRITHFFEYVIKLCNEPPINKDDFTYFKYK